MTWSLIFHFNSLYSHTISRFHPISLLKYYLKKKEAKIFIHVNILSIFSLLFFPFLFLSFLLLKYSCLYICQIFWLHFQCNVCLLFTYLFVLFFCLFIFILFLLSLQMVLFCFAILLLSIQGFRLVSTHWNNGTKEDYIFSGISKFIWIGCFKRLGSGLS